MLVKLRNDDALPVKGEMMSDYIDFDVTDLVRFESLRNVFLKLKSDKDSNTFETDDVYLIFFDSEARSYFGWYSESEIKDWERRWFSRLSRLVGPIQV